MNYRSVIAFGTCRTIGDRARKTQARQVISEHVIPGRWRDVRGPSEKELKATLVLEFLIHGAGSYVALRRHLRLLVITLFSASAL
jgi:uncharacterized protein